MLEIKLIFYILHVPIMKGRKINLNKGKIWITYTEKIIVI